MKEVIKYGMGRRSFLPLLIFFLFSLLSAFSYAEERSTFSDNSITSEESMPVATEANSKSFSLEVSGYVLGHVYRDSCLYRTSTNWFSVEIYGEDAKIKVGREKLDYEYGTIGMDSYGIVYFTNQLISQAVLTINGQNQTVALEEPVKPENEAQISINQGRVPEYSTSVTPAVWLAYCFNLDKQDCQTNHLQMAPIFSLCQGGYEYREAGGTSDIFYSLAGDSKLFIDSLTEIVNPSKLRKKGIDFPQNNVFTNTFFKTEKWFSVNNINIPQLFFTTTCINGKFENRVVFEGVATNFSMGTRKFNNLQIPDVTIVREKRPSHISPLTSFTYTTRDGSIWDKKQVETNSLFNQLIIEKNKNTSGLRFYIIFIFLLFFSAIPFIFWSKEFFK